MAPGRRADRGPAGRRALPGGRYLRTVFFNAPVPSGCTFTMPSKRLRPGCGPGRAFLEDGVEHAVLGPAVHPGVASCQSAWADSAAALLSHIQNGVQDRQVRKTDVAPLTRQFRLDATILLLAGCVECPQLHDVHYKTFKPLINNKHVALAALVPAPRAHLTRYQGVLGPAAAWRSLIVPASHDSRRETEVKPRPTAQQSAELTVAAEPCTESSARNRNYTWAELMKRVFLVDVLQCEHCGGRMKILAAIRPPTVTVRILECLGLPSRAPPLAPASSDYNCQMDAF